MRISRPRNNYAKQRISIADLSAIAGLLEHPGLRILQPFGQLFGRQKVDKLNTKDLPGRNPIEGVILPEAATKPKPTVAATREEVPAILTALKGKPVARAAVAVMAFTGIRSGGARGLRWAESDRAEQHIHVRRSIWHMQERETKTQGSVRFVTVTDELRGILLDLWNAKNCLAGTSLPGARGSPST